MAVAPLCCFCRVRDGVGAAMRVPVRLIEEFYNKNHSDDGKFASGPSGPAHPGPNPYLKGRPHHIQSEKYPDMYHVYDENGISSGMSSKEQADRYVKRRMGIIKAMATRRKAKAKGTS